MSIRGETQTHRENKDKGRDWRDVAQAKLLQDYKQTAEAKSKAKNSFSSFRARMAPLTSGLEE